MHVISVDILIHFGTHGHENGFLKTIQIILHNSYAFDKYIWVVGNHLMAGSDSSVETFACFRHSSYILKKSCCNAKLPVKPGSINIVALQAA